ncbi:hypothetical protein [Mesorhizobium sp. 113-1-2]|uniref:hypothetical protein n=1 Tax=Mesorhizobium sp. 113-1-2 TaxID=2744515 RepID=UPI0019255AB4|nr:hypothetical protein [Mesorhizobium sp. 113-1-2]
MFGNGGGAAPPAGPISYIGHSQGSVVAGAYTYASVPLSAPAADRIVVAVVRGESIGNYSTTSVVVGSTTLSLWSPGRIQVFTTVVGYYEVYYGVVASGATPNLVVTTNAQNISVDVYCLSGLSSTPVDQVGVTSASGTTCAINDVETKVGGAVIAGILVQTSAGGPTLTESWSGAGSIVEDSDIDLSANTHTGAAHIATSAATTTDDFTFTISASKTFAGGAISFGP